MNLHPWLNDWYWNKFPPEKPVILAGFLWNDTLNLPYFLTTALKAFHAKRLIGKRLDVEAQFFPLETAHSWQVKSIRSSLLENAYLQKYGVSMAIACYSQEVAEIIGGALLKKYPRKSAYQILPSAPALTIEWDDDEIINRVAWKTKLVVLSEKLNQIEAREDILAAVFPNSLVIYHDRENSVISGPEVKDNYNVSLFHKWLQNKSYISSLWVYDYASSQKIKPVIFSQDVIAKELGDIMNESGKKEKSLSPGYKHD